MPWEKRFDTDQVLDTVMQAFWARGYEATSMQDLVERTGVNRASLYATYGDKHELFLSALRMYDEKMRRKLLADLEAEYDPREAIRRLFLAFADRVGKAGGNRGCFLTNTALELAAHDPQARRVVVHAQEEIEAFFARMIVKGRLQGEIARRVDAAETARGLVASLLGFIVLTRCRPERALLVSVMDDAMRRLD